MYFFIIFTIIYCIIPFPLLGISQNNKVAKPAFLEHMLAQESDNTTSEPSPLTKKQAQKKSNNVKKQKIRLKSNFFKKSMIKTYNGICFCGGKKLWYAIMPKHIRKAPLIGSIKLLDGISFVLGILAMYGTYHVYLNKKATILSLYTSACLAFKRFFSSSTSSTTDSAENNPSITTDNNFFDNFDTVVNAQKQKSDLEDPSRPSPYILPF